MRPAVVVGTAAGTGADDGRASPVMAAGAAKGASTGVPIVKRRRVVVKTVAVDFMIKCYR
jgi:hypothetical protein